MRGSPTIRRRALLLVLLGACAKPGADGPVPLSVTPNHGTASVATPVVIGGVGFDATVKTDYSGGSGSTVQAVFVARLLPWDGTAPVDLSPVAFTEQRTLTAVVPAGLAPGRYDLAVTDPAERTGVLPDAFAIDSSAADVAAFRIDPIGAQRAGVPFPVSIAAIDSAGRVVSAFAGSATISDVGGTATPASAGPFVLGLAQVEVGVASPIAPDRLTVDDGAGHAGVSNDFDVGPPAPGAIAFVAPVTASASACSPAVEVELRSASGLPAPAIADVAVALQSGPPGALAFFSDPACAVSVASITIPAGTDRGAFYLRGAAAGTASIRLVPDVLPSAETAVAISP